MCTQNGRLAYNRFRLVVQITGLALALVSGCHVVFAHPDLQLQIDQLSAQLEHEPENVDLLLKRGDLQRRHEHWDLARVDFKRIREIQPDNDSIDWFEGRMEVQSGNPIEGVRYLDRFLLNTPGHVIALQNRAGGYLSLNQPLLAAKDFETVIRESDKPAPSIYASGALAYIAAGAQYYTAAMDTVQKGLSLFPNEITLTSIATDLSLAWSDVDTAETFISSLPAAVLSLPQWQTRIALLDCLAGSKAKAKQWFASSLVSSPRSQVSANLLAENWLTRLAAEPSVENCQAAAVEILKNPRRLQGHARVEPLDIVSI